METELMRCVWLAVVTLEAGARRLAEALEELTARCAEWSSAYAARIVRLEEKVFVDGVFE